MLKESYPLFKHNALRQKKNKAIKREENRKKKGSNKLKKLGPDQIEFIKMLLDDEKLQEQICLRTIQSKLELQFKLTVCIETIRRYITEDL